MGITITSLGIGHPVTNITTTTTVQGGFATSNTTSSEGFEAGVNRWGQAGAQIMFYNEDDRDIKYVDFQLVPFNNVGDIVGGIDSVCTVRATGPFKSHRRASTQWNYIWDGFAIKQLGITKVEITYMDGSTETVEGLKQHYDGAMGKGYALSIVLMLCSLICYICSFMLRGYSIAKLLPQSIDFTLMLVFPFLGLIFSRKKERRLATLFAALNVASCIVVVMVRMSPSGWYLFLTRMGWRYWWYLLCLLMSVILLLRATGAGLFKKYKVSKAIATWSSVGICILFIILFSVDAINYMYHDYRLVFLYMVVPLYCSYLGTLSNRYRSND